MRRIWAAFLLSAALLVVAGCTDSSDAQSAAIPLGGMGSYSVAGTIRYEDVEYGPSGQTGKTTLKPVRQAVVDLLDAGGGILATVTSDESGAFQFPTVTMLPATIRIMAQATSSSGTEIAIKSATGGGRWSATYALAGKDLTQSQQIDIALDASGIAGVFNMLDVFASGLEYVYSYHTPAAPLPPLDIFWPNSYGTYTCGVYGAKYCTSGAGIYITGALNGVYFSGYDQDHYDDDVLWHELAHYLEYSLGVTDSPGGMHLFTDNTLDLTLAWSEGHADYFQMAVKRWLLVNQPERLSIPVSSPVTYYVDTLQDGNLYIYIDLANPGGAPYVYATNEVAVANVVWKTSESFGDTAIWSAWSSYMPAITYRFRSLETFWDGLIFQAGLSESLLLGIFNSKKFDSRLINYSADSHEPDNGVGGRSLSDCTAAGNCINEVHTLYLPLLVADTDIVPIKVTAGLTYTIETANLTNGADTKLRLLDGNGQVLLNEFGAALDNDDIPSIDCDPDPYYVNYCNNGINFSSKLVYVPQADGIINVEVSNADYALYNAGAYGGYTLSVTAN